MEQLTSQNGWPAYGSKDAHRLARFQAAGLDGWAANDDVAVIWTFLIVLFVARVEPIAGRVLDDWSWNPDLRPIRGQTHGYSNHDSATAIDLNATAHPRGKRNTFTREQEKAIREILAQITDDAGREVVRWGGVYKNAPVDEMHFELIGDHTQAHQAAVKLLRPGHVTTTEEPDMQLNDPIILTPTDAAVMNRADPGHNYQPGQRLKVEYFLTWGGPGLARLHLHLNEMEARVHAHLADVERRLDALEGAPKPATGTIHQVSGVASISSGATEHQ
jgi:hypothetical protein